ncbi:methyl farnesoate epoxidase-like [Ischnura elegans]|uniref:methyl farnesoate epoxidase-like n=1 Tax=Ischnura elegans TaxID=197161 RepID=UPI001ED89433|nr:methyl farnesoate epoxidase-like [Ischnura elegans]
MEISPDLIILIAAIIAIIWMMMKKPANYPPGPPKWPVVGNLLQMKVKGQIYPAMTKMHKKYGEVVGMFAGDKAIILISGHSAIHEACFRDDMIGRPENMELKPLYGGEIYGIANTEGEVWREQRRFTLHHLRNLGFGKQISETIALEESKAIIDEIDKIIAGSKPGQPNLIDFNKILAGPNVNVLWHIMAGERFEMGDPDFLRIVNGIMAYFRSSNPDGGVLSSFPAIAKLFPSLTPMNTIKEAYDDITCALIETINEHSKTIDHEQPRDFIDLYLTEIEKHKKDPGTSFHAKNLLAICSDFFAAGTDTTISTLNHAFLYMIVHPKIQRKVQDEIDRVIGKDRMPSLEDRIRLPYVEATLNEVLRFSSIGPVSVPHSPYTSKSEISFRGYKIPKNARIFLNMYDLHHDPQIWNKPFEFIPERFLNENGEVIRHEALIPFGTGKRQCVGKSLAQINIFIFFTSIMQRYTLSVPEGQPKPSVIPQGNYVLHPVHFEAEMKLRSW